MTTPPTEHRRFTVQLPRPLWIGLTTVVLFGAAVGLRFGVPIYRQHVAIREIELLGGAVSTTPGGPEWQRELKVSDYIRDKSEILFDDVQMCLFLTTRP